MEYLIDLSQKTESFREALLKYLTGPKYQKVGCYMEYRTPELADGMSLNDYIQRLHESHDNNWCARTTDITVVGNELVITVEPFGPMRDIVIFEERWPAARMVVFDNKVISIAGFDLIPKERHTDFQNMTTGT